MRRRDESSISAEVWLRYAEEDLQVADVLRPSGFHGPVCFHAQQAAEKALKGYLAWLGEEQLPRTHDLDELVTLVRGREGRVPPVTGLPVLAEHAVATRYPQAEQPTQHDSEEALHAAREIVCWVKQAVTDRRADDAHP